MLVCWFSAFVSVMIVFHVSIRINDLCWVSGCLLISISSLCKGTRISGGDNMGLMVVQQIFLKPWKDVDHTILYTSIFHVVITKQQGTG